MPHSIQKSLAELVEAQVISVKTSADILGYYKNKSSKSQNRLFIVFGALGSMLIGLGIILIIAHNWDDFSILLKTTLAFLPLLIGQAICVYVIIKKSNSVAWRESSAVFLFFLVGSSISLVSQIYNIPGNLSSFLLSWMALCLPVIYLLRSSILSLLVIIGLTYYACETSYWTFRGEQPYGYWIGISLIFPYYISLVRKNPRSNFAQFHHWLIPLSIIVCLGIVVQSAEEIMYIAYSSLFGLLYLIGRSSYFDQLSLRNNSYLVYGSLGTIILLLILSFDWFWADLNKLNINLLSAPEIYLSLVITLVTIGFFIKQKKSQQGNGFVIMEIVFILFLFIFFLGWSAPLIAIALVNLLVLALGIFTVSKGASQNHLGIINYGLLIITSLVICRFFDMQISFVLRGLLFIVVGVGFFITNYWMLKKRKANIK